MTIEKRGNKYRIKQMHEGKYYCITLDHKPKVKEAEQLIALKIAKESENPLDKGDFEVYAYRYISSKKNVLKKGSSVKYESMLIHMPEWFKKLEFKDITQEDIQKLVNEYSLNHKPKGVGNLHGFVASVIGVYRPSMKLKTTLPKIQKNTNKYRPTDEDIKAILKRSEGTEYEVIFNLLVYGLRRSEALAIDVNTDLSNRKEKTTTLSINKAYVIDENGEYYIRNENKTPESCRNIEISNELADKMVAQGYIFKYKPHMLNKELNRYQKELDIPHFSVHAFRSYYASMMLGLNVPITYVESSGGWKHGSMALKNAYTYTQEQKLKKEQEKGVDFISSLMA